ncbi:hypothetical protein FOA52_009027 [Chlamydomonas sp. UWO 241]|nr:hypothetical protein FOA52_009027 [Chlamydomonas sp. UWO 241]
MDAGRGGPAGGMPGDGGDDGDGRVPWQLGALIPAALPTAPTFRFWIDEMLWSHGHLATHMIEAALLEAGGQRAGGPTRAAAHVSGSGKMLGADHVQRWELLWTKSSYALKCARSLRPGQAISAIVGLNCLTMKKRMQQALKATYGSAAFDDIMPLSFALPGELPEWRAWVKSAGGRCPALWILKTGQDAGRGLALLPTRAALAAAESEAALLLAAGVGGGSIDGSDSAGKSGRGRGGGGREGGRGRGGGSGPSSVPKASHQLKVAQLYLPRPLLLEGRKWHARLWLLVTCASPLRAYVHTRGLVLFSSDPYDPAIPVSCDGSIAPGHVTNLARNSSGLLLGVDVMVDDEMRPWLLEFNSSPSIMVEHDDPATARDIFDEKAAMLRDMVAMVVPRLHRPGDAGGGDGGGGGGGGEEVAVGGFVPLDVQSA